jgi:uncharacterized lipoprotein YajG
MKQFLRRWQVWHGVLLVAITSLLTGCATNQQAGGANAEIRLAVQQTAVGPAQVDVQLNDKQGQPISGADVQLRGDMTHAGMQPVLIAMEDVGSGQYRAPDFRFTMAGDWILTVEATLPDGSRAQRMFEVRGVKEH